MVHPKKDAEPAPDFLDDSYFEDKEGTETGEVANDSTDDGAKSCLHNCKVPITKPILTKNFQRTRPFVQDYSQNRKTTSEGVTNNLKSEETLSISGSSRSICVSSRKSGASFSVRSGSVDLVCKLSVIIQPMSIGDQKST